MSTDVIQETINAIRADLSRLEAAHVARTPTIRQKKVGNLTLKRIPGDRLTIIYQAKVLGETCVEVTEQNMCEFARALRDLGVV